MSEKRLVKVMVAPSIVLILIVAAWPIIYAVWLSLHQYSLIHAGLSRWAGPLGLGNYKDALQDPDFWSAVRVTFIFTIASVFLGTLLGLAMAMAMHAAFIAGGARRLEMATPQRRLTIMLISS
jgi:multiple sugar transport system permease protein